MTATFPILPYLFLLSPNLSYPLPFLHQALSYTSPEKAARRLEIMKVKKAGKVIINKVYLEDAKVKADKLQSQGDVAKLLAEEEKDIPWQSLIYEGVMAWAARATTNCLATPDNFAKWKRIVDPKCPLCSVSPCTLGYMLSNCQEALDRFEWS